MSKTIVIGCRLPCGIVLDLIDASGKTVNVELNGQNSNQEGSPIILLSKRDYGVTDVDADFLSFGLPGRNWLFKVNI